VVSSEIGAIGNRWIDFRHAWAGIDPNHDGDAFSFYYWSRLDINLHDGSVFDCEDLRDGCPGVVAGDGYAGTYSYLAVDTGPDRR
jgi:hypothetical protein